jgi:hypothetical protein
VRPPPFQEPSRAHGSIPTNLHGYSDKTADLFARRAVFERRKCVASGCLGVRRQLPGGPTATGCVQFGTRKIGISALREAAMAK